MEKIEHCGGLPDVGLVPRAHAGPRLRHLDEPEHVTPLAGPA